MRDRDRSKRLTYRGANNFTFLVKWDYSSYRTATWEDELTVKLVSEAKLEQYICRQ